MAKATNHPIPRVARLLAAAAVVLMFGACSSEDFPMTVAQIEHDYRLRHPVTVEQGSAVTWISFSGETAALGAADVAKLGRYFASFIEAGHGPITATMSRDKVSEALVRERIQALRTVAAQDGVRRGEIDFVIAPSVAAPDGPVAAKLGYTRYIAGLPKCPDWSKDTAYSSTNTDHSNFGCATQSNWGAMVVDPADLIRMRPLSPSDAAVGDNAIRVLRAPASAATGAAATTGTAQ